MGKLGDPYKLTELLDIKLGAHQEERDHPPMMFQPSGGMGQIPRAMEATLPKGTIQLNSEITEIKQTENSVTVTYKIQNRVLLKPSLVIMQFPVSFFRH